MNDDQRDAILLDIQKQLGRVEEYITESKSNKKFWLTGIIAAIASVIGGMFTHR